MDDLISRETMKDLIDITTWYHQNRNKDMVEGASDEETAWFKAKDVFKAIENVPSAQPDVPDANVGDMINRQDVLALAKDVILINGAKHRCIDATQIHELPSAQPEYHLDEWCTDCKEYDQEKHCCPRFNHVIRTTLQDAQRTGKWIKADTHNYLFFKNDRIYKCSNCGHLLDFEGVNGGRGDANYCPNCGARLEVEE